MSENAQAERVNGPAGASSLTGFFAEAIDIWRRLPHKFLFAVLLVAWIALFRFFGNATLGYVPTPSLFEWAESVYFWRVDDQFGMYMPLVVILFFWIKRKELAEISPRIWWPALGYFVG